MNFLYALFFGAGVAAFAYTKLGRRAGYGNTKDVVTISAVAFVLSSIFFYTILAFIIGA
ncbi:MAG: hypothetical protein JWO35_918 [Candidatus Saccharibacteria bacterium]|nr:hypothetical protein [Candidatus Saccharibacteria bacterium]